MPSGSSDMEVSAASTRCSLQVLLVLFRVVVYNQLTYSQNDGWMDLLARSSTAISVFSLYFYTHKLIILDEDDFAPIAVLKEGAMPAFGMFVLTWVLVYTHLHGIPASME